jgi:yecA family protein
MTYENSSQLAWFKAYAASGRAPRWTMEPADIHGFLTGLAMAGGLPEPDWMAWIWSGETPQFASREEARNVLGELRGFEAQIRRSLTSYRILTAVALPRSENGQFYAADWAEGFLQAIEAHPEPWQKVVEMAEASLTTVLAACYHNHEDGNGGHIGLDRLDELNYHLRHLNRIMKSAVDDALPGARAA